MNGRFSLVASVIGIGLSGTLSCTIAEAPQNDDAQAVLGCSSSDDCSTGEICLTPKGYCIDSRQLSRSLVLEVTPGLGDPADIGTRYYAYPQLEPAEHLEPHELVLPSWVNVQGSISADTSQQQCQLLPQSTLPARLKFTPRETLLGLNAPSFELETTLDLQTQEHIFSGSIPPGNYDVYIRPDASALNDNCLAVPQIYRDRTIVDGQALVFEQPELSTLPLTFPWEDDSLDGWRLDMIDPDSGEVISNQIELSSENVLDDATTLGATLIYSSAVEQQGATGPSELLRLRPPQEIVAGTVLIVRSGLVVGSDGRASVGKVTTPVAPVEVQAWLWSAESIPAPSTVQFAARALDDAADVTTSFSVTTTSNLRGEIRVSLLPGLYRVRKYPAVTHRGLTSAWSGSEQLFTVHPDVAVQAAQRLSVSSSMNHSGRVVALSTAQFPIVVPDAFVLATASYTDGSGCLRDSNNYGQFATADCEAPLSPLLSRARAQDPYTPRSRATRLNRDGNFELSGLDCGTCANGRGATFDITIRPALSSGLAWLLRTRVNIRPQANPQPAFVLAAPVIQNFTVRYAGAMGEQEETVATASSPVQDARIRAFVVLDENLEITDDLSRPACRATAETPSDGCLSTALQIAEGQTDGAGNWSLLYPPDRL